jgi:hypothetical protein
MAFSVIGYYVFQNADYLLSFFLGLFTYPNSSGVRDNLLPHGFFLMLPSVSAETPDV